MKFLQIGLGSMGKRRVRNLLANRAGTQNIAGFDLSAERREEAEQKYGITTFSDFSSAIKTWEPEVLLISTPPHLHAEYFLFAAKHNLHFFSEVATTDDGYKQLLKLLPNMTAVAASSCNMRYFPPITTIKKIIDQGKIGRVEAFTHHMGQYLPDWHPWEDYRQFYVSKKESSACREMVPFELAWIQWVIGEEVSEVKGMRGKCSDLEMEADDTYSALLRTKNGVMGTLLVDVISRAPFRTFRVLGSEGVLEWHWIEHKIRLFSARTKKWQTIPLPKGRKVKGYLTTTEEMYEEEIKVFLQAIKGKRKYPYTFAEEYHNLHLLKKIEESA